MRPNNVSGSQGLTYYYPKYHKIDPRFTSQDTFWHGGLAESFGLHGSIKQADFANLLAGNDLNGNQLIRDGRNKQGKAEHRSATDISFSAPKSLSLSALHADFKDLLKAHQKAVIATLNYIEDKHLFIRKYHDNQQQVYLSRKALFAVFPHSISRSLDPQLHSHCLIMNISNYDGKYYALWSDSIYRHQRLIESVYLSNLAHEVRQLGYPISLRKDGFFEITSVKDEWIKMFSKRTRDIEEAEQKIQAETGVASLSPAIRRQVVLASRQAKNRSVTASDLHELWNSQLDRYELIKAIHNSRSLSLPQHKISASDYIRLAVANIHESESLFSKADCINNALQISRGFYRYPEMEKAFRQLVKEREILLQQINMRVSSRFNEALFTSHKMKQLEADLLQRIFKGKDNCQPMLSPEQTDKHLSAYDYFTHGQKEAVTHILTSTDRFSLIQGDAGVGKTSALTAVREILETENSPFRLRGLGYTGRTSEELELSAGIKSDTISHFLQGKNLSINKAEIWLVDESSLVGSSQLSALTDKALSHQARLILIGDCHQIQSISAGRFFTDLQHNGQMKIVTMNERLRQKTPNAQKLVSEVTEYQMGKRGNLSSVFTLLKQENNIVEIPQQSECIKALVTDYCSRKNYHKTMIITATREHRLAINLYVRQELQQRGLIDKQDYLLSVMAPVSLTGTDRYFAHSYQIGQRAFVNAKIAGIHLNQPQQSVTIPAGQVVQITQTATQYNRLTLTNGAQNINVSLKHHAHKLSWYEDRRAGFSVGDKIVFLKNDRQLSVKNGNTGIIKALDDIGNLSIKLDSGKQRQFNLKQYAYIDHAYAISVHKSQGATAKDVIFYADSAFPSMNRTEFLYVALSRAQYSTKLYTDNIKNIQKQFERGQEKTSTLSPVKKLGKGFALGM